MHTSYNIKESSNPCYNCNDGNSLHKLPVLGLLFYSAPVPENIDCTEAKRQFGVCIFFTVGCTAPAYIYNNIQSALLVP